LDQWLKDEDVPGIYGIDTRKLTKKLRVKGVMLGILRVCEEDEEPDIQTLLKKIQTIQDPNSTDLAKQVTVKESILYSVGGNKTAVLIDCGVKYGILRNLLRRGFDVVRVPYDLSAEQIMEYKPDGVMISNGPGDPKQCTKTVETVRQLLDEDVPMMGVCLGTQILALALGGDTYKLKYGHRSQNQPVLDLDSGKCFITTQNHGYTVEGGSLDGTGLEAWFMNANDKTTEGIKHKTKPAFALQWHPEASPGPYDTQFLFDKFQKLTEGK
jgi:carbamoyl-phosphate synthase small subunit